MKEEEEGEEEDEEDITMGGDRAAEGLLRKTSISSKAVWTTGKRKASIWNIAGTH